MLCRCLGVVLKIFSRAKAEVKKAILGISVPFCIQICREEDRGIPSTFSKQIFDFSLEVDFDAVDAVYAVDTGGGLQYLTI